MAASAARSRWIRWHASFQSSTARGDCAASAIRAACRRESARIFRISPSSFSMFMASIWRLAHCAMHFLSTSEANSDRVRGGRIGVPFRDNPRWDVLEIPVALGKKDFSALCNPPYWVRLAGLAFIHNEAPPSDRPSPRAGRAASRRPVPRPSATGKPQRTSSGRWARPDKGDCASRG